MQSHRNGKEVLPEPQTEQQDRRNHDSITKENTYQIFSNNRYILKLSYTCETLYRYEIISGTNFVRRPIVFKRIFFMNEADFELKRIHGIREWFGDITYAVYLFARNGKVVGYMISKERKNGIVTNILERMYFLPTQNVGKRR